MIEAHIFDDDKEVGLIKIEYLDTHEDQTSDYAVYFVVDRLAAIGLHTRVIKYFPNSKYNVLGLFKMAIETLDQSELELEYDETASRDLARRLDGPRKALSGKKAYPVHHY